jgi:hypothetical protein
LIVNNISGDNYGLHIMLWWFEFTGWWDSEPQIVNLYKRNGLVNIEGEDYYISWFGMILKDENNNLIQSWSTISWNKLYLSLTGETNLTW